MRQQSTTIMQCSTCNLESSGVRDFCPHCGVAMIGDGNVPHLGQYRLNAKLGEGGMGVVYQAMDEKLHREVAVKVLHPHLLQNENLKERFRREARMHAKLMHPNVVTLLSIYEDGEHMALVMEMVHGRNLKEHIKKNPNLSLVDLVKISDSILAGLESAHHLGMVHRDLKPANVLISDEGAVKLMDFGLAKPERGDDDLTQSGATVGSFRYMAPEQILNQPVDARTDLYAFGILLYQVCTGKLPFDASASGGGEFEIMEKQVREEPVAPHELVPSLPMPLSDLILLLLEKTPADRPADCAAVRKMLHAMLKTDSSDQRLQSVRMPTRQANDDSSSDIAKGLLRALWQSLFGTLRTATKAVKPGLTAMQGKIKPGISIMQNRIEKSVSVLPISKQWQAPLTWGSILLFVVLLGWILVSVMGVAERSSEGDSMVESSVQPDAEKREAVKETPQATLKKELTAVEKPKETSKPVAKPKPVAPKPKVVASKPKPVKRSITYYVGHKVVRSDSSRVDSKKPHEFRGGNHLYFPELKSYRWKETLHTVRRGEVRLYLSKATRLSAIVLKKATVGRSNFKDGEVGLEVQNSKGNWNQLFYRKDDDVDIAVRITRPSKYLKDVKGIRLRFKTPEPITIGPIDLLR